MTLQIKLEAKQAMYDLYRPIVWRIYTPTHTNKKDKVPKYDWKETILIDHVV